MTGGSLRDKYGQGAQVQAKGPVLSHEQFRENINQLPWYAAMGTELAADFVAPTAMIASDLAMAGNAYDKGNYLESALYGLSSIPFIGGVATGARQLLKTPLSKAVTDTAAPLAKAPVKAAANQMNRLAQMRKQIQDEYFEKHGYRPQVIFHESNAKHLDADTFSYGRPTYDVNKAWTGSQDKRVSHIGEGIYGHMGGDTWTDFGKGDNIFAVISDEFAQFPTGVGRGLDAELGKGIAGGDLFRAGSGGVHGSTSDKLMEYFMDGSNVSEIRALGERLKYFGGT
jgi:hypothetical protein